MEIKVNTDKNIKGSDRLEGYVSEVVQNGLKHFDGKLTRVEVFLKDENAGKSGPKDKKCTMEARPSGLKAVTVSYSDDHMEKAIKGSLDKLKAALNNTIGKLQTH